MLVLVVKEMELKEAIKTALLAVDPETSDSALGNLTQRT
jgi:hypothetical protein